MEGDKKSGRGRGRGRGARGPGRPPSKSSRGRGKTPTSGGTDVLRRRVGRPRKMVIESDEEEIETSEIVDNQIEIDDDDHDDEMVIDERENDLPEEHEAGVSSVVGSSSSVVVEEELPKVEFTLDDDISQLVPPTFSTVSKGPPQPMLELRWDHKYTPLGDKLPTPNIHMCVECKLPIRIYGRLIPCKHVYCHACASKQSHCSCCNDRVNRIEAAHLGQVFMCHHGGTRYGFEGCRRTYLSQRDLQAHVEHRHMPRSSVGDHEDVRGPSGGGGRQNNIPVHYSSSSSNRGGPGNNSQGRSSESSTPGSRYERKSSFNRNQSWGSYNNSNNRF